MSVDPRAISDYIHVSKYAKFRPEWGRRETYEETVARVEEMHLKRFPDLEDDIKSAFDLVREKKVLPSMRAMQFGGPAMEAINARGFNCSATLIDRPRAFAEAFYLLLCGCGVGYSVQNRHVDKLPLLANQDGTVIHHIVEDTIEGWANAAEALIDCAIAGLHVEFAYNLIRPRGATLKTSGGKAPGHLPLKKALENARTVLLGAQGRRLRPFECHKIMCFFADAVLSGGIRRSAMIALFSLEDKEMLMCKAGNWFADAPYLARANNSVVLKRDEVDENEFKAVFEMTKQFGEPGFMFENDWDHVRNPCAEIGLDPVYVDEYGNKHTGWAFCNLCEINAALLKTEQDFTDAAWAATVIGTLQASYTSMPYLGKITEKIAQRDALIGIGMTGMQDAPDIALNPQIQRRIAKRVVLLNNIYANAIGINPAARCTTVKPSGTTTLELSSSVKGGAIGSGIHPHHHDKYIRRITATDLETPFLVFKETNPGMCVEKPNGDWVIEFPVQVQDGAVLKKDLTAIEFLEQVRSTQQHWVQPGTTRGNLTHNVSNTVSVKPEEWDQVADYLWSNRWDFTGVSFIPDDGDTIYDFAPFEAVKSEQQEHRWNELAAMYKTVDYSVINDAGDMAGESACAGGACER